MADDPQDGGNEGQPDGGLDSRVSKLETGQETLAGKLDQLIGMVSGGGSGDGHESEPTGGNVAAEIRTQLDQRDAAAAAKSREDARDSELAGLKAKVAELSETPPTPMPTRRSKIMGWT
jgi:hypothetical protein